MPAAGWMRRWRGGRGLKEEASAPVVSAAMLDREGAREERTASREMVRKIIENSSDFLVVLDEQGEIQEASRTAAMLLFPQQGRIDGARLEELFSPVARDAVSEWRARLRSPAASPARKKDASPPVFEAALERGGIVRMLLRCEFAGMGGMGRGGSFKLRTKGPSRPSAIRKNA
jgi:PAS domain-containing protein